MLKKIGSYCLGMFLLVLTATVGFKTAIYFYYSGSRITVDLKIPDKPLKTSGGFSVEELGCMARTVYGESRNQSRAGQEAVAAVIVARSLAPEWAFNICSVVQERNQFSGYSAKVIPKTKLQIKAWQKAIDVSVYVTDNWAMLNPEITSNLYFQVLGSNDRFFSKLTLSTAIEDHTFYRR